MPSGGVAIEVGRRYIQAALDDNTSGNLRRIADVMVTAAQSSMHQWLNLTLVIGGGLVIVGVIVSLLSEPVQASGAEMRTPART